LVQAQRHEEALAILGPVLEAKGGEEASGTVRRAVAACHLALGKPASAREVLSPYAQAHPEDTIAQLMLAKAALACDDVLTALRAVDLVQQRQPDQPELWLVRAALNFKRGRLIPAASDLYDVLQNDPDDVDAHCLLAEVMRARDQADTARTHFERALAIDPTCTWANMGLNALTRGEPDSLPGRTNPSQRLTSAP
jgi:Tfp pilus assembly protein PilF